MNVIQLVLEHVKEAGIRVVGLWAGLLLAIHLSFVYFARQELTPREFQGAVLFCGVVALGAVAIYDRVRGRPSTKRKKKKGKSQ